MVEVITMKNENPESGPRGAATTARVSQNRQRRYSSDEAADIIRLALQSDTASADSSIDYDELLSIGREVGVTDAQIDLAVELLQEQQSAKDKEHVLWARFQAHAAIFVVINVFLFVLNLMTGMDTFWVGYVVLTWGLFLLGHYAGVRYAPEFVQMAMERTQQLSRQQVSSLVDDDPQVSFSFTDSSGLVTSEGMVSIEEGKLVVEHHKLDAVMGVIKSGVKRNEVAFTDIVSMRIEPKFWSSHLVIRGRNMQALNGMPGLTAGTVSLPLNRRAQAAGFQLVEEFSAAKE